MAVHFDQREDLRDTLTAELAMAEMLAQQNIHTIEAELASANREREELRATLMAESSAISRSVEDASK